MKFKYKHLETNMYAVVEFKNSDGDSSGEISIVPLLWLNKNDKKCYWPSRIGKVSFSDFVQKQTPYKKSWPNYAVFKVHFKTDDYALADKRLQNLIQDVAESSAESTRSLKKRIVEQNSTDESSSDEDNLQDMHLNDSQLLNISDIPIAIENTILQDFVTNSDKQSLQNLVSPSPSLATTVTASGSCCSSSVGCCISQEFQNTVLGSLAKLTAVQENQFIAINELLRRATGDQIPPPGNMPSLPFERIEDFQKFDSSLANDADLRDYMTRRLAAVGGSGIESLTRRMLKFVLSNNVAVHYNWKGREKLPFEKTNMMNIIYEAAKLNFNNTEKNDYIVANVVKDWLKYAKSRMTMKK